MDLISILGYSKGSPYAHNPYLDIHTPEGLIDMSNTPIDLIGIDNLGNKKKMKAGSKNPYKFEGDLVREIPFGNIYQQGGFSKQDLFNFLFEEEPKKQIVSGEVAQPEITPDEQVSKEIPDSDYEIALQIANNIGDSTPEMEFPEGNPYGVKSERNPYKPTGKESPNALATLQEFQPQGFTNLGIWPSKQHMLQNPKSDHNTGRALDLGVNSSIKGDAAVTKLQAEAQQKNIKYIIWNRKIWNPQTNTWRPYNGKDPHTSHIHISFNQ